MGPSLGKVEDVPGPMRCGEGRGGVGDCRVMF